MTLYLVCYDITNDSRRTKVSKLLEAYGLRVQKSVFEIVCDDRQYPKLQHRLRKTIDETEDRLRFYPLPVSARQKVVILGVRPEFAIDDVTFIL